MDCSRTADGGRAGVEEGGAAPSEPELGLATIDNQGRLPLRGLAGRLSWRAGDPVGLTIEEDVLRLSDTRGAFIEAEGVVLSLDQRCRVQLPYGVRLVTGLVPGTRVMLLVTVDRGLVVVPVARMVSRQELRGSQ
jgi:hypothetical protein